MFFKIGVLKNFEKFTGKQLRNSLTGEIFKNTVFLRTTPVPALPNSTNMNELKGIPHRFLL